MTFVFARSNCDGGGAMVHHVNENVVHDQWIRSKLRRGLCIEIVV